MNSERTSMDGSIYPDVTRDFYCEVGHTLPTWFREPGERAHLRPYSHTPLRPYDPETLENQLFIKNEMKKLAHHPPVDGVTPEMIHLVEIDFQAGASHRETKSYANYCNWETNQPDEVECLEADPEMHWALGEARSGHARPSGIINLLRHAPSLISSDLQVLSTPYGYRTEHIPAMTTELEQAISDHQGEYYPDAPIMRDKINLAPHFDYDANADRKVNAILLTYKRHIGKVYADNENQTDPIEIYERHAELFRVDSQSGFPRDILRAYSSTDVNDRPPQEASEKLKDMIINHETESFRIPLSVMTYACREELLVKTEQESGRRYPPHVYWLGETSHRLASMSEAEESDETL